jgi:hypothetical protein
MSQAWPLLRISQVRESVPAPPFTVSVRAEAPLRVLP